MFQRIIFFFTCKPILHSSVFGTVNVDLKIESATIREFIDFILGLCSLNLTCIEWHVGTSLFIEHNKPPLRSPSIS